MAEKKKKRKWIKWVVIGVVLLVIGGIVYSVYDAIQKANDMLANAIPSVEVVRDDISMVVQAGGVVDSVEVTDIYAPFGATVDTVPVKNGDVVKTGDILVTLKNEKLDDEIEALEAKLDDIDANLQAAGAMKSSSVNSPVAGRVKAIYAAEDQAISATMQNSGALFLISADNSMEIRIPATDAIKAGDPVEVTVGDDTVDSTIQMISGDEAILLIEDDGYEVGASASVKDASDNVIGDGILAIHAPYLVTAEQGVVSEISVKINDKVTAGGRLLKLEEAVYPDSYYDLLSDRTETFSDIEEKKSQIENMQITATTDGVVSGLNVTTGAPVSEDMLVCSVKGTASYKIKLAVDELDIATVAVGQKADIVLDALPNRIFTGLVTHISGLGTTMNGVTTYEVSVLLDDPTDIRAGMSARADIVTETRTGVIVIPANAIKTIDGEKYVMVVPDPSSPDAFTAVPVETKITIGLYTGAEAEVLSGLTEGQYVQDLKAESPLAGLMAMRSSGMGG